MRLMLSSCRSKRTTYAIIITRSDKYCAVSSRCQRLRPGDVNPSPKTVECGSAWTFYPPLAATCCAQQRDHRDRRGDQRAHTPTGTVTNGVCPQIITQTWLITDACGNSATCSQTVTVENTNPPVLMCASNMTVSSGMAWSFNPPTASDACCTNLTITVLDTVTNVQRQPLRDQLHAHLAGDGLLQQHGHVQPDGDGGEHQSAGDQLSEQHRGRVLHERAGLLQRYRHQRLLQQRDGGVHAALVLLLCAGNGDDGELRGDGLLQQHGHLQLYGDGPGRLRDPADQHGFVAAL